MRQSAELQDEAVNCPDRAVTEAGTDIDILILIFQRQVDRFQKSPGLQIRDVPRATGGAASTRTPTGGWLGSLAWR